MDALRRELPPDADPDSPLPGPPDPWAAADQPSRRDRPPFHMTAAIAREPGLAARLLAGLQPATSAAAVLADALHEAGARGRPVLVTGCGTSEHAAVGTAAILRDAWRAAGLASAAGEAGGPTAVQAFELALDPPDSGIVIGISHEGGTAATTAALRSARSAGARTALITVTGRSPGAREADLVIETGELDPSWCHTVGYLSPLLAAVSVGGHLSGAVVSPQGVAARLVAGIDAALTPRAGSPAPAETMAAAIADAAGLVVLASGADRAAGRELTLKVEEAAWIPSRYRDLETMLHGHLPATDAGTALVLVLAEPRGREARIRRARQVLQAAQVLGLRAGAIIAAGVDESLPEALTPAGRIVVPESPELAASAGALLGTATPLQLLTERVARARGTNPDPIRRDDPRYRQASEAAES